MKGNYPTKCLAVGNNSLASSPTRHKVIMVCIKRVFLYTQPQNQTLKPKFIELGLNITSPISKMVQRKSMRVHDSDKQTGNDDDRFTSLPNDVIHHIYSFLDTENVVQSSLLSRGWRNTWKSHPHLKFKIYPSIHHKFPNFVHRFLSARDKKADLSTIDFRSNSIPLRLLKEIITYGISHNTQKVNIEYLSSIATRRGGFDLSLFKSHFLKDLRLKIDFAFLKTPNLTWDLPALTTLHLERVRFTPYPPNDDGSNTKSLELFSTIPNLKNLVLVDCRLWAINTFYITSSGLENLTIHRAHHTCQLVISAPKVSSLTYDRMDPSLLSVNNLDSLETLSLRNLYDKSMGQKPKYDELMSNTFKQLYKTKFLTLNIRTLMFLSRFPELLEKRGCPFVRLECLIVEEMSPSYVVFNNIGHYFRSGSPGCMVYTKCI